MKRCFKCGVDKPHSEFYKHAGMADGLLGKCKACTKADESARRAKNSSDITWVENERARWREKIRRSRANGTEKAPSKEARQKTVREHALRYPEKHAARIAVGNAVKSGVLVRKACEVCGSTDSEAHHDDYSKPLDVVWLCPKHHAERHVELRRKQKEWDHFLATA